MNTRLSLLAGISALSLGACATAPEYADHAPSSAADRHRIEVAETGERVEIPVAPGDVALTRDADIHLRNFASDYLRFGHGSLVLSTPANSDNAESAVLLSQQARMTLVDAGVPYAAVASSTYEAGGVSSAPIRIVFTRYEARAPDCKPIWEQDLAHHGNTPWESFGCATQANLAALVEDPHDLIAPRGEEPGDAGRRGTVMEAYRRGEQTHAERSGDERVTISNAVN
jgi:pilus assembly protein CpaD